MTLAVRFLTSILSVFGSPFMSPFATSPLNRTRSADDSRSISGILALAPHTAVCSEVASAESGALLAVTVQPADRGDTTSYIETLEAA